MLVVRTYKTDHRNPRRLRYGWRLAPSGHIVVDPAQRDCIFLMLELRQRELTLRQICEALRLAATPAPRHATWYCATVKKIIEQNTHLEALLPHMRRRHRACWSSTLPLPGTEPVRARRRRHSFASASL